MSRPRLNALIREGLRQPLLVMLAGPGYGKTQAMATYLAESGARALWLRLTGLDNLPTHFWNHLTRAFEADYPGLAQALSALGFPNNLSRFAVFIQLLEKHYPGPGPLIWVFDDFGVIGDERIKHFFRLLVEVKLEKFPLVLISSELTSTDSIAFMSSRRFLLLTKDLRFSREEIAELYQLYGLSLEPGELDRLERHTEGWALALHLLAQSRDKRPNTRLLGEIAITHLFEEKFFSPYSRPQQLLVTRMSLLNYFPRDLAIELYDQPATELEELANHPFLRHEPGTGRLYMHHLYRLFLEKKQYLLSEEERRETWRKAAEHYSAAGDALEAINSFYQARDLAGLLKAISGLAIKLGGILEKEADFLLEYLDLLTPQEVQQYPAADYFRAHIYMNILEVDRAEALLTSLEKRLLERNRPDETALLGDVYVGLGFICMMRNQEDYGRFFQKADACLPNGSSFFDRRILAIGNNNCFALGDNQPGARERMIEAAHQAAPWVNKVLRGCMSGMEHIIAAEAAYMTGDFEKARQAAYRGIYKAEINGQHDYALNGLFVLARSGWLSGDLAEMSRQVQSAAKYAARYEVALLEEIRDTTLTWYYLKLEDFNRIPTTIITMDHSKRPLPTIGRPQMAYASYLLVKEEYARLVGRLENPRGLFLTGGIWHDRIYLFVMLAIGHQRLGNAGAALKALWTAYDMCRHNQVSTPFIEFGEYMPPLLDLAREGREYDFDPPWLDLISARSAAFAGQAVAVRAEYRRLNPARTAPDNPLSKRERVVLQALAHGLTREEIALKQYISVNTVKAAIRSIYTKLKANNRAEAVSIAISHGYIEGYLPR